MGQVPCHVIERNVRAVEVYPLDGFVTYGQRSALWTIENFPRIAAVATIVKHFVLSSAIFPLLDYQGCNFAIQLQWPEGDTSGAIKCRLLYGSADQKVKHPTLPNATLTVLCLDRSQYLSVDLTPTVDAKSPFVTFVTTADLGKLMQASTGELHVRLTI